MIQEKLLKKLLENYNYNFRIQINNNLFIKELYNKIRSSYNKQNKNKNDYKIISEKFIIEEYNFLKNTKYLDARIYKNIRLNIKSNYKIIKDNITLNIFTTNLKITKKIKNDIDNYLMIILILNELYGIKKKKDKYIDISM